MNKQKLTVREFLKDIADNEIIIGKKYNLRIEINDGGENSYIGLCVDVEDWHHQSRKSTQAVRIFRNTNSVSHLENEWGFTLGGVCHPYIDNPDIPLEFTSYGKTYEISEKEAQEYFTEIKRQVKKQTAAYKVEKAKSETEEREALLARLAELGEQHD